jgi:hypothetical protein
VSWKWLFDMEAVARIESPTDGLKWLLLHPTEVLAGDLGPTLFRFRAVKLVNR